MRIKAAIIWFKKEYFYYDSIMVPGWHPSLSGFATSLCHFFLWNGARMPWLTFLAPSASAPVMLLALRTAIW